VGWRGLHGGGNVVGGCGWCLHWYHRTHRVGVGGQRVEAEKEPVPVAVGSGVDIYAGAARNRVGVLICCLGEPKAPKNCVGVWLG